PPQRLLKRLRPPLKKLLQHPQPWVVEIGNMVTPAQDLNTTHGQRLRASVIAIVIIVRIILVLYSIGECAIAAMATQPTTPVGPAPQMSPNLLPS
ncbi:MAG: hypothetical protein EBR01_14845, partial [Proteobacteria bacterium]|nr:hypothetical protein [Pseudomonadota bacterium]